MKKLRELKEFVAVEGKDRLDSELEGLSRDVLRQVSQAADLPVKVSGQTLTASELRHALLGVLIPSEEQEEAGWGEMQFRVLHGGHRILRDSGVIFFWRRCRRIVPLLFSMSGSSKSKRWHEEAAAIERDSGGGRS